MKKPLLLTLLICQLTNVAFSQCPNPLVYDPATYPAHADISSIMTLNIVTDFCATGNGTTNDAAAFKAASDFINARQGYCKLVIPPGTYIVGKQAPTASRYLSTTDVLLLNGVKQVEIAGQNKPVLKYEGNGVLKYGYFNSDGSPRMLNSGPPNFDALNPLFAADLGCMIRILSSSKVKVSDLILDGNLHPNEIVIGGHDIGNFNGIQEDYSGIGIWYSDSVEIDHIRAERMGLDGFYIYNTRDDGSGYNHKSVRLDDCISDFNGRQGISIIGGENITVNYSHFTNIGMGEITFSGLQAGVDIEPETADHSVKNVTFNNCTFSNCRNSGVVISAGTDAVREIYFNHCIIDNLSETGNNTALSLGRHNKIKFTDCELYGYVTIDASNATSYDDGYSFKRCLFSDCSHKTITWTSPGNPPAQHCAQVRKPMVLTSSILIYSFSSWDYVSMDSCTFDLYTKRPWYFANVTPGSPSVISNSTIYVNGQSGIDFPVSTAGETVLQSDGVTLSNNQFYMHSTQEYLNSGTIISGVTPLTTTTTWSGNTFYRWTANLPARICADTLPCPSVWSTTAPSEQKMISYFDAQISISPNPTDGIFRLNLGEEPDNASILAMSTDGRIILNQKLSSRYIDLDIAAVPAGIYIIRITTRRGTTIKKLFKD